MKNAIIFALGILFVLCSCSSVKVVSDFENGTDFSSFSSFSIVEVDKGQTGVSDINLRRIMNAVNSELAAKGLKQMSGGDLEVHLHGLVKDKTSTDVSTDYYGYGYYRRGFGYGTMVTRVDTYEYQEGSLIIDLVDSKKKELVWQGIGTARLNDKPKGREERIQNAVKEILKAYPPSN